MPRHCTHSVHTRQDHARPGSALCSRPPLTAPEFDPARPVSPPLREGGLCGALPSVLAFPVAARPSDSFFLYSTSSRAMFPIPRLFLEAGAPGLARAADGSLGVLCRVSVSGRDDGPAVAVCLPFGLASTSAGGGPVRGLVELGSMKSRQQSSRVPDLSPSRSELSIESSMVRRRSWSVSRNSSVPSDSLSDPSGSPFSSGGGVSDWRKAMR